MPTRFTLSKCQNNLFLILNSVLNFDYVNTLVGKTPYFAKTIFPSPNSFYKSSLWVYGCVYSQKGLFRIQCHSYKSEFSSAFVSYRTVLLILACVCKGYVANPYWIFSCVHKVALPTNIGVMSQTLPKKKNRWWVRNASYQKQIHCQIHLGCFQFFNSL